MGASAPLGTLHMHNLQQAPAATAAAGVYGLGSGLQLQQAGGGFGGMQQQGGATAPSASAHMFGASPGGPFGQQGVQGLGGNLGFGGGVLPADGGSAMGIGGALHGGGGVGSSSGVAPIAPPPRFVGGGSLWG